MSRKDTDDHKDQSLEFRLLGVVSRLDKGTHGTGGSGRCLKQNRCPSAVPPPTWQVKALLRYLASQGGGGLRAVCGSTASSCAPRPLPCPPLAGPAPPPVAVASASLTPEDPLNADLEAISTSALPPSSPLGPILLPFEPPPTIPLAARPTAMSATGTAKYPPSFPPHDQPPIFLPPPWPSSSVVNGLLAS